MDTAAELGSAPERPRISLVDHLIATLKRHGVDTVFGLPGSAVGPVLDRLLADTDIRLVIARHESGAVAMADGYARVTGRLGVALVTSGPGALNALPHLAVAQTDNSPVLLLSGEVARAHHGRGGVQEGTADGINTVGLFGQCTKYSRELAHIHSAETLIDNAIRHALCAPRGAAHLSIPVDLFAEQMTPRPFPQVTAGSASTPDEGARQVLDALLQGERPLVLLGNGARSAVQDRPDLVKELLAFCERFAVPVATTQKAKGLFPEDRPEALGVVSIGGSQRARAYLQSEPPDVVVVVGSSLGEWASRNWTPALQGTRKLFQVDVDATKIGRSYRVDHLIQADAGDFLRALLAEAAWRADEPDLNATERRRAHLQMLPGILAEASPDQLQAIPIKPQALMHYLRAWLNGIAEKNIFVDVGNGTGWFTQRVAGDPSSRLYYPWGLASMGWANAAVIGAKLAMPDTVCLTVTGDGGFLMNAVEIATASQLNVGAIWVVLDDNAYNMVRQGMRHAFPGSRRVTDEDFRLGGPDLAALARSLGARSYQVRRPDDIAPALLEAGRGAARDRQPQVICVAIDADEPGPFHDRHDAVNHAFQGSERAPDLPAEAGQLA